MIAYLRDLIGNTARTDGYWASDYDLPREVLAHFARIVILPQIGREQTG